MRIVCKILLAPVWLILFLLKWICVIVTGFASVFLRFGGVLLIAIGITHCVLRFEPIQIFRVFVVGIGAIAAPTVASIIIGVPEAGHNLIGEYITES